MPRTKINVTIDEELLKRLDNYADDNYMTRSGVISIAVNHYISAAEITSSIRKMAIAMRKIADDGKIDEEAREMLQDVERLSRVLSVGINST